MASLALAYSLSEWLWLASRLADWLADTSVERVRLASIAALALAARETAMRVLCDCRKLKATLVEALALTR